MICYIGKVRLEFIDLKLSTNKALCRLLCYVVDCIKLRKVSNATELCKVFLELTQALRVDHLTRCFKALL